MSSWVGNARLEPSDSILNFLCVGTAVTKDQSASRWGFQITHRQRHCRNPILSGQPCDFAIVNTWRQQRDQMHSRLCSDDLKRASELRADGIDKYAAPLHIEGTHPANMASKISLTDELGQDRLIQSG